MSWSRARALVLAAVVAWVVVLTWQLADRQQTATEQTGRANAAERTAADLADEIARVCRTGGPPAAALGPACRDAEQVQRRTPPTPDDGRGIASTSITNGRLIVAYDDGQRRDVGQVVGPTGSSGPAGRGITGTALDGGRLVAAYTDGTTTDLGRIAPRDGVAGRSIASVAADDGRLIVTYSDGTSEDAGPLPPGPPGADGTNGVDGRDGAPPAGWTSTRADGSTEQCARAPSPDTAPTYRCTVTGTTTPPTTTAEPSSTAPPTDPPR
ncbi:hypothetical protein [Saccharopolyspora sp. 6V]|uniref:hypothetical protein n=1 Tax=Saccharopolyspora sp. 6V TaxID=2877239 RepID=UPI001CD6D2AF|nr:hypothetical protein [Saccharopolyspora sp. 6V]MCA1195143.1 hypothetical protein [Saccharopolyspora sp. 6V]